MDWPQITPARRRFLQRATSTYQAALAEHEPAQEYLRQRGIDSDTAATFQLGYVAEPFDGHEPARGFLSFPHRSFAGPTGIRFRRVGDDESKKRWWGEAGQRSELYNVIDLHRPESYVAICEGQTDTVTLSGLVGVPAVGISGSGKWEPFWDLLFVDYDEVFVVVDPDAAGDNAARKLLERLGHNAKQIRLPADINKTYLAEGSEFIREKMGLK